MPGIRLGFGFGFVAAMVIALGCTGTPSVAQNVPGDGETPGYPEPPQYPTEPTCYAGCGDADNGIRPAQRVQVTTGARYEYVVIGPQGQAEAVRSAIEATGGVVVRRSDLAALRQVTQIATFPSAAAYERAQSLIAQQAPGSALALHHLYWFAQARRAPRLYAPTLIGDAAPGHCRLIRPLTVGLIDGPVNTAHPALQGVDLTYENLVPGHQFPSADHGTAVAALIAGEDSTGALAGYARGARLYAISVFSRRGDTEEASVEHIVEAIDRMVGAGVRLINLSIAGPENPALGRALNAAAHLGVVLIAASGNERRPAVAWPAASVDVIAVTAVDAARRRFRLANTGAQIEFAAPGVDVYAATERGAGYVSGTSFAAPIVTALAARAMARGAGSAEAVRAQLRAGVETLGPGARNTDFGWGLVKASSC